MAPALRPRVFHAFSLVEMIAVVAIIVIMVSLLGPAISSFSSTAGRKGAVNILMNTLEQARAAALEKNCDVSVLLWQREYPSRDAIMVIREPSPWIVDAKGAAETNLIPLTKWIQLPEGVLLHKPTKGATVFSSGNAASILSDEFSQIPNGGGGAAPPHDDHVAIVKFNSTGAIVAPSDPANARIVITEGVRGVGGTEAVLAGRKEQQNTPGGGFDVITLARFTGRPRLDVTTLDATP
ncbi:MAG: type II secretion system protein [Terrimicrobiaceae bacterium]|nr:type II secretion system protein [Terrimicrobiaceae bacterium]